MRTSFVIGASSLRRLASGALVAGLLTAGLAALGAAPASALDSTRGDGHRDGYVGSPWDGGEARTGGVEYSWAPSTFDYVGNTCPELDSGKIDLTRESATQVITAPEGELISSYCIKSGSDNTGEGPKIVELDEPVARLTIAYPVDGKCKNISHYAVAYVDATTAPSSPPPAAETPAPESSETPAPESSETPAPSDDETFTPVVVETPVASPETKPADQAPSGQTRVVVATVPSPAPTATPSSTASAAAALPGDDTTPSAGAGNARLAATDEGPVVRSTGRLAFTGAQVAGVLVAAVVLVAVGTLAVHAARRRAGADA